jgi:hypothetical protein
MIDSHRNQNSHNSLAHTEDVFPTKNYQENSTKIIQKTLTEYIKSFNFFTKILKKISLYAREHLLRKSSFQNKRSRKSANPKSHMVPKKKPKGLPFLYHSFHILCIPVLDHSTLFSQAS